jgi:hypothetical protein
MEDKLPEFKLNDIVLICCSDAISSLYTNHHFDGRTGRVTEIFDCKTMYDAQHVTGIPVKGFWMFVSIDDEEDLDTYFFHETELAVVCKEGL